LSAKERAEKGGVSQPEEEEMKKFTYPPHDEITKMGGDLNRVKDVIFDLGDCIFALFGTG
jgi:hypothetical protein